MCYYLVVTRFMKKKKLCKCHDLKRCSMHHYLCPDESCECTCVFTIEQRLEKRAKRRENEYDTIYADALKEIRRLKKLNRRK